MKMESAHLMHLFAVFVFVLSNYCPTLAEWNTKDYLKKEHSLVKPYNDGKWDFIGSTIVTNKYVRLTPDHQSRKGAIWNTVPCYTRDWELHVHFKVHGKGTDLFGDGMAIWYTKHRQQLGPVFGNRDYFRGLAVLLDTYSNQNGPHNHGHPYVSATISNGSDHYDHDRDGTHTELAGCESKFRGLKQDTYIAIRYEKNKLTVSTDIEGKNVWKQCFSTEGVHLPTGYFFGASAATGDLADNHDIISMKLYDIAVDPSDDNEDYSKIDPSADIFASPRDHVEDPDVSSWRPTGLRLLLLIICIVVGVGVAIMVGLLIYSNNQDNARKRFY